MQQSHKIFLDIIKDVNPKANLALIEKARLFAEKVHRTHVRKSGEPYITHPLMVTQYLMQQGIADTASICSCLLHDCVEDGDITSADIVREFGPDIASIVDGLTKVDRSEKLKNYDAENLRKIILASAKDARVIIIKLCDILHNLNTIQGLSLEKQTRYANIALHVYAPIAEKIGLYRIKGEIEERCLDILHPHVYRYLDTHVKATREEREANTDRLIAEIQQVLEDNNVLARVLGRAKDLYSIYKKMHKHNRTFEQIYDFYGIRIITKNKEDCYKVHELLNNRWDQVPKRYKDYIQDPKLNGYQSLHDNFIVNGKVVEIQIRTEEMNNEAEFGAAIHWKYKTTEQDKKFDKKITYMKQILRWKTELKDAHLIDDNFIFDAFKDQIIVITPKGDPIIIEEDSTALDFAFAVHSNIGTHAKSATINGEEKTLDTVLKSGDIVSITTARQPTINSGWLSFAMTKGARSKIKQVLEIQRTKTKQKGGQRELKKIRKDLEELKNLEVYGVKLPVQIAHCCNPRFGDSIVAYYTKDRKKITVHKESCSNRFMINQKQKVNVAWEKKPEDYSLSISCEDKPGILIAVLDIIAKAGIRVKTVRSKVTKNSLIITANCDERISTHHRTTILEELKKVSSFISLETDLEKS